ncbi:hypothetical protein Tco_1292872 [Tanacetum coccineum]
MEDLEQAFVEYASSRIDEAGGDLEDTNTIACIEERSDTPLLEWKDITDVGNLGSNKDDQGIEWLDVEEPLDLVDTSKESVYESLIKDIQTASKRKFTYVIDFMIVEDISSIIDPRLSQVVLGKPFAKISNMTHDPPEGVVRFTNRTDEVAYKMPHKIEQYNSLSDLEKKQTKSVYLRNEEDKRRGVEYVMSKILRFYKECLELGPEYVTRMDDEGEVALYLMRRSLEVLRKFHWTTLGGRFNQLSHVSSTLLSKPGEY